MKALIFNFSSVFGGQERYLINLAHALRGSIEFGLVGSIGDVSDEKFKPVYRISGSFALQNRRNIRKVLQNTGDVDCFLLNGNRALYLVALATFGFMGVKTPVVYVQHSNVEDKQSGLYKQLFRKFILRLLLKNVDKVIRVSDSTLPLSYAHGKIITIYNGVDPAIFFPSKNKPSKFIALMVGALNHNKNQLLAIRALQYVPDLYLKLAGDGPLRKELEQEAHHLGVHNRVEFLGQINDMAPVYREASVCLMLSKNEGLPFAILEAMSSGLPIISTKVGGVPEVIREGVEGYYLDRDDPELLSRILIKLQTENEMAERMKQAARKRIEEKFTQEIMAEKTLQVIKDILN